MNWFDHNPLSVVTEDDEGHGKDAAGKDSGTELVNGLHPRAVADVDARISDQFFAALKQAF